MLFRLLAIFTLGTAICLPVAVAQDDEGGGSGDDSYMREELGVNETTTPQIQKLLADLDDFQPLPVDLLAENDLNAVFPNRFQTALHFGITVADGFVLVINERPQSVEALGRALLQQARALGVGDSLTRRAASLIDLGRKGDWVRMREELIKTQADVEQAMMTLHDEELAHLISFGGWLRGFQLAVNATADHYTAERAAGLLKLDVMSYFIDRLDSLNPRVKRSPVVADLISKMKTIFAIASKASNRPPSQSEVKDMRDLANQMVTVSLSKVNDKDHLLDIRE
jgi:hypothetical protein